MLNSSDARRGPTTWWVGFLSLVVCLGAGSAGLRAQERLAATPVTLHEAGEFVALIIHAQHPMKQCLARAKVDYLIEELITQRLENARLSIGLAEAKAQGAEIKEVSRQQEALLKALMAAVATRESQEAIVRSENADLRQRLEAAQAELQRRAPENNRLAAELAAAHRAADSATMMARENLALITAQITAFHAAAGEATPEQANQPDGLLSALWVDAHPAAAEFRLEAMR